MAPEYWILIIAAAAIAAAIAGFAGGRLSAPGERRMREMARERDEARSEAEQVRGEVARHFDESARMFGRLAQDYRAFFEHFAETAQNLGMSEGRARELLHRADPRIVDASSEAAGGDAAEEAGTGATAATDTGDDLEAEAERVTRPAAGDVAPDPAQGDDAAAGATGDAEGRQQPTASPGEDAAAGAQPDAAEPSAATPQAAENADTEEPKAADADEPKSEVERQRAARGDSA